GDDILGTSPMLGLQFLLKGSLKVLQLALRISNILNLRLHEIQDHPASFFDSAVQINGAEDRLEAIHKQGLFRPPARLFLASSELQVVAQMNPFCVLHQIRRTDEKTLQL